MASQLYPKGGEHILGGDIDFASDNLKMLFYSGPFSGTDEFVADLTGADIIARGPNLTGKSITNGLFDCNDFSVSAVSGSAFTHVILYKDTGSDATSELLAIFDISSFTPTGANVSVVINASGVLTIVP